MCGRRRVHISDLRETCKHEEETTALGVDAVVYGVKRQRERLQNYMPSYCYRMDDGEHQTRTSLTHRRMRCVLPCVARMGLFPVVPGPFHRSVHLRSDAGRRNLCSSCQFLTNPRGGTDIWQATYHGSM